MAPADKTKTYDNTPTFMWTAITDVSLPVTYDLQVDNDNDFLSPEINVTGLTDNTYTPPSELANGNYSWRVCARDNASNAGAWSQSWALLINSTPHDATVTLVPVNSKPGISIDYMLTVMDNATGDNIDNVILKVPLDENGNALYRVVGIISAPPGWTSVVPEIDNFGYARKVRWWTDNAWAHIAAGTSENFIFTASTPLYDGIYTWTCGTKDVINYMDNDNFTTRVDNVPPPAPTLSEPADGTKTTDNTPTFKWMAVDDNSTPVTCTIQVDNDNDFSSPEIDVSGLTDNAYTPPVALAGDNYSWRVRAVDNAGNLSTFSSTWTLTIVPILRGVKVSISPSYQGGAPYTWLEYIVTVINTGNVLDNYALTVNDNENWGPTVSPTSLTVPAGENRTLTLSVVIPENAVPCTEDNITVIATSQADNTVKDNASCIAHAVTPWAGTVKFKLENLYKVSLEKDLQLNTGSKLVVKFYTYTGDNQGESVIEDFAPPITILENENVPHPLGEPVEIARLVLTTNDTENVISTIASFTATKGVLANRYLAIKLEYVKPGADKPALANEYLKIKTQYVKAPS